jgi:putative oxidoreductase
MVPAALGATAAVTAAVVGARTRRVRERERAERLGDQAPLFEE